MNKKINVADVFFSLINLAGVALALFLIIGIIFTAHATVPAVEVETYTVGCEVSQMAYAEEAINRSQTRPVYKMGVRNDEFACTFDIDANQFAKYVTGDIVEVEVTVWEHPNGELTYSYQLIG